MDAFNKSKTYTMFTKRGVSERTRSQSSPFVISLSKSYNSNLLKPKGTLSLTLVQAVIALYRIAKVTLFRDHKTTGYVGRVHETTPAPNGIST